MLVLDAGADGHVFASEGVVEHAEQIILQLPDHGMGR
jgi:hypothetical protein